MHTFKKQQGMATILLVLLIGITVMLITASVARALITKKEAATAAHAQTNAQILGWAGVSAFREFLVQIGGNSFEGLNILKAPNYKKTLTDANGNNVTAKNIIVTGCETATAACSVTADISANSTNSKAATTIRVVYNLTLTQGTVAVSTINFGGKTVFSGLTTIKGESPNSKVTLNVDGDLTLNLLFKTENLSELNINATGDVYIDCGHQNCGDAIINVKSKGKVTLLTGKNFGNIEALGPVLVETGAKAQNIKSNSEVKVISGAEVQNIETMGDVTLSTGQAQNIKAHGSVSLSSSTASNIESRASVTLTSSTASNVTSNGNVILWTGSSTKDITAKNKVEIHTNTQAGNIKAGGEVSVAGINSIAKNIESMGEVKLSTGGKAQNIKAHGSVSLSSSTASNIESRASVTLDTNSTASNVTSNGNVILWTGSSTKDITAKNKVEIHTNTQAGNIKAGGNVLVTGAGARADNIESLGEVELSIAGAKALDIYANKVVLAVTVSANNVYSVTNIVNEINTTTSVSNRAESINRNSSIATTKLADLQNYLASINPTVVINNINININEVILDLIFNNNVDVRVYKNDANYIFTSNGGFDRVFLNHLKNKHNTITYMYKNNSQYAIETDGTESLINSEGFSIGDYTLNGKTYTGAICLTVVEGKCTSEIIGYLPRISVSKTLGIDDDYSYGKVLNRWRVRSISDPSTIDNATLAPGIMYFEGSLEFAGGTTWRSDSLTNAYTNSFLAEGEIWSIAFSPRIYAPHEVIREGADKVSLICNRRLKHANNNTDLNIANTSPTTLSDRYLIPTNLCKSDDEFLHDMSKNEDGTPKKVIIDGKEMNKLDLGNIAFMANEQIHMGACTRIYGDVFSRKGITTSAGCGFTENKNQIVGSINTQGEGKNGNTINNHVLGGSTFVLPSQNTGGVGSGSGSSAGTGLKVQNLDIKWSRYL
ncbi:hypothetical protein [Acinetobacter sp. ASP199]|uniref:hypothetical protein n=1 Tax=unclassified Acinetobacter TaxID=196816 RepID=UPI001F61FD6F|nr:hypothetical protein [Acinetobacter sp. ASP199]UNT59814.1 hypothetical protein IHE35_02990 [Acinetobacter sp. ASP199]